MKPKIYLTSIFTAFVLVALWSAVQFLPTRVVVAASPAQELAATATATHTATPTPARTKVTDDALTEAFADFLIVRYDPARNIIYIEPIDPNAKIVIRNAANVSTSAAAPAATGLPKATPMPLDAAALRGKILFKSTREHGSYPDEYLYYVMNPDGTGVTRVDTDSAKALLNVIEGKEGFSPDGQSVVMGDRACGTYEDDECSLYILNTALHSGMIFSDDEPSQGVWFSQKDVKAKEPAWSPRGDYIIFVSNHESPPGCRKTSNIFKGTVGQKPVIRRLTEYCAGADSGRPSFNPEGTQVVYWTQFPGPHRDLYIVDVGADDSFDYRSTKPKRITFEGDNWDAIWIK